jgi:SARP family transcriptional regulator, regulator of embCAB operon
MAEKALDFGVLGPLQVTVDGTPLALGTPKQKAVLAMLIINRNRPVATHALIEAAWEQWPPAAPQASLHSYISNLRKILDNAGVDSSKHLARVPPGYRLMTHENACDIARFVFEKTAGVQAAAAGRFEQASRHTSAALAEWRGPVLDDLRRDFQFADAYAAALIEDKMVAHTAWAEAEIACGRNYAVIGEFEALTADHPYHEPLWTQLITAYYLAERQSDALDAYRRLKAALADDLGIDPGPTVRALNERILRQEPVDVRQAAKATAAGTVTRIDQRTAVNANSAIAQLRDTAGRTHALQAAATRIGRLSDNDIVLDDPNVSRHHAAVIDTGINFVIFDTRSANGVYVQHQRIRRSVALNDGDHIRICNHEFTFEIQPRG